MESLATTVYRFEWRAEVLPFISESLALSLEPFSCLESSDSSEYIRESSCDAGGDQASFGVGVCTSLEPSFQA
jgi:hypothetical protein